MCPPSNACARQQAYNCKHWTGVLSLQCLSLWALWTCSISANGSYITNSCARTHWISVGSWNLSLSFTTIVRANLNIRNKLLTYLPAVFTLKVMLSACSWPNSITRQVRISRRCVTFTIWSLQRIHLLCISYSQYELFWFNNFDSIKAFWTKLRALLNKIKFNKPNSNNKCQKQC